MKFQSVLAPCGLIIQLDGPYVGKMHYMKMLRKLKLVNRIERLNLKFHVLSEERLMIYGDKVYQRSLFVAPPFKDPPAGFVKSRVNRRMASVRIAVEWGFAKVGNIYKFTRDADDRRFFLMPVVKLLPCAVFLTNIHTCLYGNQTAKYFDCKPPIFEEYLSKDITV